MLAAESAVDNLDDELSVKFIQEIMDWCGSHRVISKVSDTTRVYLCGHSRVGLPLLLLTRILPSLCITYVCVSAQGQGLQIAAQFACHVNCWRPCITCQSVRRLQQLHDSLFSLLNLFVVPRVVCA